MNRYKRYWSKYIGTVLVLTLFAGGLFSRCANISGSPQGGPKDSLPPRVVSMSPAFNSTNLTPERITVEFDEYVQLKDVQNEFFTSPFMDRKPVVTVKGKGIVIDVKTKLDSNTTYVLNLGSSVVDNNEGNPYHGLKYTFSTGPWIDSMYMSGYVSDAKTTDTVKGAYVFFFDAKADSVPAYDSVLRKSKALAVAKNMSDGIFVYANLKPIDYRVYAMKDNNGNQIYDPGVDEVAFMDTVYNPSKMPSFLMWYDSVKRYPVAEPQIFMRTFLENPDRRQNLSAFSRPLAQQLMMKFSSKNPQIEKFTLRGIDPSKIIVEQIRENHDSTLYWLDIPKDQLPDTIIADLIYQRHDSAGLLYPHTQELKFVFKRPFVSERDRKKEEEKKEQPDTVKKKSEMKFSFEMDSPLIPDNNMTMKFELPVGKIDMKRIALTHTDLKGKEQKVPFTMERDSVHIRTYQIKSKWVESDKYELLIPEGALMTIDGVVNDTIRQEFMVADPEKLSLVIVNLTETDPESEYIIQIFDEKGTKLLKEKTHLTGGRDTLKYITPGTVTMRLVEDRNKNGKWDTGDLIKRVQPELVETYINPSTGTSGIITKANWEIEFEIDIKELFKPRVHISSPDPHQHEAIDSLAPPGGVPLADSTAVVAKGVETIEIINLKEQEKQAKAAAAKAKEEKKQARRERKTQVATEPENEEQNRNDDGKKH